MPSAGGSEDALYLNVFVDEAASLKAEANNEKLPVFVWVHGGGLKVGASQDYNPTALAKEGSHSGNDKLSLRYIWAFCPPGY